MCDKPCATCPWLKEQQTPEAIEASPIDGSGRHWFEVDNLKYHWKDVANGSILPCHATDSRAPLYGGKACKVEQGRTCVGLSILIAREIRLFMERGTDFKRYKAVRGIRMTLQGLAMWASRFVYAGSVLQVEGREMIIPTVEDDDRITTPWADKLHNSTKESM